MNWSFAKDIPGLGDIGEPIFGLLNIFSPKNFLKGLVCVDSIDDVGRFPFHEVDPKVSKSKGSNRIVLAPT